MFEARTEPRGPEIAQQDVELHRQVHPSWLEQDGRPSSLVFRPGKKDNGLLSLADGRLRTAEAAWRFHTGLGFASIGSMSLSVGLFHEQEIRVYEDRLKKVEDGHDDEAHAVSDHRDLSDKEKRRVAKIKGKGARLAAA